MTEVFTNEFHSIIFGPPKEEIQVEKFRAEPFFTMKQVLNRRSEVTDVCFDISPNCGIVRSLTADSVFIEDFQFRSYAANPFGAKESFSARTN
jgi:hypothetical protein